MGNDPPAISNGPQQKLNQTEVLNQATKVVQQLKIFQTQQQYREQKHLFARILIYGHVNLLNHLRKFKRQQQRQIIRDLKSIQYQTTDLLYQNLVIKKMKQERKKNQFSEYKQYRLKSKQLSDNLHKYKMIEAEGEGLLNSKKVGVLLYAGGFSSRFIDSSNKIVFKQTYIQHQNQKCLLQIAVDKLSHKSKLYQGFPIYLVYNEGNRMQTNKIINKYPNLTIKKVMQQQSPIVNLSGKLCLKKAEDFEIFTSPRGCGDLANLTVKGVKLLQQMKNNGIQVVISIGIQNILADVLDAYMIGVLSSSPISSIVFKCTYPDNENENLKRVIFNKSKSCLQALELENLLENADKNSYSLIRHSPVWMNNIAFRLKDVENYIQSKKSNFSSQQSQLFSANKIQLTYWDPQSSLYMQLQHCYSFQRQTGNLLLNQQLKSIGIMVERQHQFAPVITIRGSQWTWQDAYSQYLYHEGKQNKIIREENYHSYVALEKSQM